MEHIYKIDVTAKMGYYVPITKELDDLITLKFLSKKDTYYVPAGTEIYLLGQSAHMDKATVKKKCLPVDNSKISFKLSDIQGAGCYFLVFFANKKDVITIPLYMFYQTQKTSNQSSSSSSGSNDLTKMLSEINRIFNDIKNLDDTYAKKSDLPRLANYAKLEDLSRYALKTNIPDVSQLISSDDCLTMIENYFKHHNNDIDVDEVNGMISDFIDKLNITDGHDGKDGQDGYTPQRGVDYMNESDLAHINAQISANVTDYIESHKEELRGKDGESIKGEDGYTPVRGKDYMNEDDVNAINSQIESSVGDYVEAHKDELKGTDGRDGKNGRDGKDGQSIKGDKGDSGESAYETWISLGNEGTEADFIASLKGAKGDSIKGDKGDSIKGDKGDNGLSAYEIWLAEGNEGTTHDFLESLKGQKGDKGDDGNVGEIHMEDYAKKQDLPNMKNYVQDEEMSAALSEYAKKEDIPTDITLSDADNIDFADNKWQIPSSTTTNTNIDFTNEKWSME